MSSNFEFFAGQPAAPSAASTWAPAAPIDQRFGSPVGEWQPTLTAPVGQFSPTARSPRRALVIGAAVVALVVVAAGAFYLSKRTHPVRLPATLAGLPAVSIPKADAHEFDSTRHSLTSDGLRGVSFGVYGGGQQALTVIAGRTSSNAPEFNQLANAMSQAGQIEGVTVTPQTLTSGATTLHCATITAQGQSVPFCAWQGAHAVLFGVGEGMSAQDTADAVEDARMDAALH